MYATIANCNFCMHYCNWQLLFVLLQVTTIVCTIAVFMHISSSPFLYEWNWHSCYALLHMIFLHYANQNIQLIFIWQLLYTHFMYDCKGCFIYAQLHIYTVILSCFIYDEEKSATITPLSRKIERFILLPLRLCKASEG